MAHTNSIVTHTYLTVKKWQLYMARGLECQVNQVLSADFRYIQLAIYSYHQMMPS